MAATPTTTVTDQGNFLDGVCRGGKMVKNGGFLVGYRPVELWEIKFL